MAMFTKGATPVHKATIVPRGQALGMVTQLPDKDETSISKVSHGLQLQSLWRTPTAAVS